MTRIRAAVCRAFGAPLSIETVDIRAPMGREIEVTLDAVAICHSDISYAAGDWGGTLPAVYGHEAAGRVTALGPDATGFVAGDRVVVTLIRSCGGCPSCDAGAPANCEGDTASTPVLTSETGPLVSAMNAGAFAERVVVDPSQIVRIGEDIPAPAASILGCGVITGVGAAVNSAAVTEGETVVVIGAGGVGLNAIQGARIAGARHVIAVDMTEEKLADARAFGATATVLASDPAPWDAVRRIAGRGADAVLVTVGKGAAYTTAPSYLAPRGRLVIVGMPATGDEARYDAGAIAAAGQRFIGSKMGDAVIARDIPWLAGLYAEGRLRLDELVSRTWTLEQINEAIADTKSGAARRNVIVF